MGKNWDFQSRSAYTRYFLFLDGKIILDNPIIFSELEQTYLVLGAKLLTDQFRNLFFECTVIHNSFLRQADWCRSRRNVRAAASDDGVHEIDRNEKGE
jgi:hypothetical protein